MAFIPDEAIDRMTELSAGAWRLYCFLARCRNQKTGKCCPSLNLIMETTGIKKSQTYEFRKELIRAGWAVFDGNNVISLFGFKIPESRTTSAVNKPVTLNFPKSRNFPESRNEVSEIPESFSDIPESFSDIPESLIRKNQQIEPAKEPANKYMSSLVLEVFDYWKAALNHPQAKLTPERKKKIEERLSQGYTVAQIKTAIDGCRASPHHMGQNDTGTVYDSIELICRSGDKLEFFISRSNSSGRNKVNHRETHGERTARETAELIAEAFTPASGDSDADPADPGAPWIAADFNRL
jgi:hypothetical protein